ncbi:angiotensin-converting enzyme 2-like isoform X1 [Vespa velutina]|uniref:angiotensin-converting enzyme 2-like isoform X1 n=1 Tax=Vespa velutina TaxID=202808 RepID=UPI001FB32655|nr:angiotensin-converting enzyme 2-like isoform X1 [Vespa velutina]XP_047345334.1 angiotensin-converting enzyme 2-like isoform X1 [Vespa velutina]
MVPKWSWIVFNLFIYAIATSYDDNAKAIIEFTELGYEDICYDAAIAEWLFINSSLLDQTTYTTWEEKQIEYGNYKKIQREEIHNISKIILSDSLLAYKYNVIEKPGDALLDEKDFKKLVHFANSAEVLRLSVKNINKTNNYLREDFERLLSHNGHENDKLNVWKSWYQELNPLVKNFSYILSLIEKAAKANDVDNVKEYWEMLSVYPNGYEDIKTQWNRISSLHKIILEFARTHLSHKYGINLTETIPAHLLGSLQGHEWSTFSIDMPPYSEITYNIRKNLWKKKLFGKSLYKAASNMGTILLGQVPQSNFWIKSQFHCHCPPKLINFCKDGITRISTCFEPTIANFLLAHKNIGKILFQQISVQNTPILNIANRYSVLEEALSELFGILSVSPVWLQRNHLIYNISDTDQKIVSLMITALDVLPRLAYYISADIWRINAIENNITDSTELIKSWWKHKLEFEGISEPESMNTPTFLNDEYITNNKPYLSKFAGILLAFQIYEHIMESTEVRYDISTKKINSNLIKLIQQGSAENWIDALSKLFEIDDISIYALTSFFSPLESFIEELNEEEIDHNFESNGDVELEEVERMIIKEMNAPTTTPTTTTTTKKIRTTLSTTPKYAQKRFNDSAKFLKPIEFDLSSNIQADKPKSDTDSETKQTTVNPYEQSFDFNNLENEDEKKPKMHTSKAVWAVAAVLIATVTICIIAIFGRQRCRKTSKNRRYV